jgi:hypothetical protein
MKGLQSVYSQIINILKENDVLMNITPPRPYLMMSNTNDIFQVDYLPEKREIRINLPEEVWNNIDTVIMTRLFQEELVVGKQKESEVEEDG